MIRPNDAPAAATAPKTPSARLRAGPSANVVVMSDRRRRGERAAQARQSAPGEQDALGLRDPAQQGRRDEQRDAGEQEATAAEQVARAPGEDQEAAEGQGVERDDVLQAADRDREVGLDLRQRDVRDRVVEHEHELHGAQQAEDESGPRRSIRGRAVHDATAGSAARAVRSAAAHHASFSRTRTASSACQGSRSAPSSSKAM